MAKKIFILSIVLIASSFSIPKKKSFIPPGTVQITETFFADETEITNFSWWEYEYWIKTKYGSHSNEYKAVLPDTLVWHQKLSYSEPYVDYYYRHPAYKDYPVVGVGYEQAVAYCKWRTERVKDFYSIRYKKELNIEYRLPTKEEWERLATAPSFLNKKGQNENGKIALNCQRPVSDSLYLLKGSVRDAADVTAPVKSYDKNWYGIYNMIGNVAEMLAEKGVSKGGSWKHQVEDCRPGKDIPYDKPSAWLGFRCVCTIKQ